MYLLVKSVRTELWRGTPHTLPGSPISKVDIQCDILITSGVRLTLGFQIQVFMQRIPPVWQCYSPTEHAEGTLARAQQQKKNHSYHLCNTLSTNVLGEDQPGRYELNVNKNKIQLKQEINQTATNQLLKPWLPPKRYPSKKDEHCMRRNRTVWSGWHGIKLIKAECFSQTITTEIFLHA